MDNFRKLLGKFKFKTISMETKQNISYLISMEATNVLIDNMSLFELENWKYHCQHINFILIWNTLSLKLQNKGFQHKI